MRIIICKQNVYGGTDKLLDRLAEWLICNNYDVDIFGVGIIQKDVVYNLAIIPSSQLDNLWMLKKRGVVVERLLVWILGGGAFSDSYYNESQDNGIKRWMVKIIRNEAKRTLFWLTKSNAIIFTDEVGRHNTYEKANLYYDERQENNIIPIAIEINKENHYSIDRIYQKNCVRLAWIGRVSTDFKYIPIKHLIDDIDKNKKLFDRDFSLTIVGTGNAIDKIKKIANSKMFEINFVDEIPYMDLGDYIEQNIDLLFAMGTSALDGAKVFCPTVVITPVRDYDKEEVYYRWIYESKGFSLGEFPGMDIKTKQKRHSFEEILNEYMKSDIHANKSYQYACNFEESVVFNKLINRELPSVLSKDMWKHIHFFYNYKTLKEKIKRIIKK